MNWKKFITEHSDILLIFTGGAFLRLRHIVRDDMWYDEAFTGILMRLPLKQFIEFTLGDPTPPLYYVLVRIWSALFGVGDIQLRLFSVLTGLATVILVYFTARKLFNKEAAIFSSILVALSPFFIGYSVEARSYSLFGLITVATLYVLVQKRLFVFMLGVLTMLLTHYFAVFFIVPLLALYFWIIKENKFSFKKGLIRIVPIIIIVLLLPYHIQNNAAQNLNLSWVKEATVLRLPQTTAAHLFGVKVKLTGADEVNDVKFLTDEFVWGTLFFTLYIVAAGIHLYKHRTKLLSEVKFIILFLSSLVVPLSVIMFSLITDKNLYVERYLFATAIFFALALGYLLERLLSFEYIVLVLLGYVFLLTQISPPNYYKGMKILKEDYSNSGKTIVFTSPINYVVGRYYLGENLVNVRLHDPDNPNETYSSWQLIPESAYIPVLSDAVIVTADESKLDTNLFVQLDKAGDYKIFVPTNYLYLPLAN